MNEPCDFCGCDFDEWELVEIETEPGVTALVCPDCLAARTTCRWPAILKKGKEYEIIVKHLNGVLPATKASMLQMTVDLQAKELEALRAQINQLLGIK